MFPRAGGSALSHVYKLCIPELMMTLMEINLKSSVYPSVAAVFSPVPLLLFHQFDIQLFRRHFIQSGGLPNAMFRSRVWACLFHGLVMLLLFTQKALLGPRNALYKLNS